MQINSLNIFVSAQEVESRAKKFLAGIPELKDCAVELRDGAVVLRRGVGPFVFELTWQVAALATNAVAVELAGVKPSLMGGATMKDALMSQIEKKLAGIAGVRVEGRAIHADAGAIMPPKSTWFEPKLRSGVAIHTLD